MNTRTASCSCGQLTVVTAGDPIRVSVCHCLACQRRTGSVFGAQARFARKSFAAPNFPAPAFSVYEDRMHSWVALPPDVEHLA
jgi:hypothetical protein